jgi:hypothetical protein
MGWYKTMRKDCHIPTKVVGHPSCELWIKQNRTGMTLVYIGILTSGNHAASDFGYLMAHEGNACLPSTRPRLTEYRSMLVRPWEVKRSQSGEEEHMVASSTIQL